MQSPLRSSIALSWLSSVTLHLVLWGLLILAYRFSEISRQEQPADTNQELIGALGELNVVDETPVFEFAGELSTKLERPTGLGDELVLQMSQQLRNPGFGSSSIAGDDDWIGLPGAEEQGEGGGGDGVLLNAGAHCRQNSKIR